MNIAPSYVASIVSIIMVFQQAVGLNLASETWTGFIVVVCSVVVAIRQIITNRATPFGGRPTTFTE